MAHGQKIGKSNNLKEIGSK